MKLRAASYCSDFQIKIAIVGLAIAIRMAEFDCLRIRNSVESGLLTNSN